MAQTMQFKKVFGSVEEYRAATEPGYRKPTVVDPLERFHVAGWWFNGQIEKDGDKPALPLTVKIASEHEAKQKARAGWRPLIDKDGRPGVEDLVVGLFAAHFKGKDDVPEPIAARLKAAASALALAPKK